MADNKRDSILFANDLTRQRREWIERAVQGARGRSPVPDLGALPDAPPRPRLYVVHGNRSR